MSIWETSAMLMPTMATLAAGVYLILSLQAKAGAARYQYKEYRANPVSANGNGHGPKTRSQFGVTRPKARTAIRWEDWLPEDWLPPR